MRPSLDKIFLQVAQVISQRSTCLRKKVGGILVSKDGKIISSGWNGVPSGHVHCEDIFHGHDPNSQDFYDSHGAWSQEYELHAEHNLLMYPNKSEMTNGTIYLTMSPCSNCAKLIIASGVKRVVYPIEYDRDVKGIKLLSDSGVKCDKITLDE